MTTDNRLVVTPRMRQVPIALCAVGVIAFVIGLVTTPQRTWLNLLIDGFLVLALGVIGIFFIATQRLTGSKWWVPIRRVPEAFSLLMPAAADTSMPHTSWRCRRSSSMMPRPKRSG